MAEERFDVNLVRMIAGEFYFLASLRQGRDLHPHGRRSGNGSGRIPPLSLIVPSFRHVFPDAIHDTFRPAGGQSSCPSGTHRPPRDLEAAAHTLPRRDTEAGVRDRAALGGRAMRQALVERGGARVVQAARMVAGIYKATAAYALRMIAAGTSSSHWPVTVGSRRRRCSAR
jgi:hypothetical protein